MDFMILFYLYVLTCVLVVSLYLAEDTPLLKAGLIGQLRSYLYQGLVRTTRNIPLPIKTRICHLYDIVFFRKNAVFQALYVILIVTGHTVLVIDGFPYLYAVNPETNHVLRPLALLVLNTVFLIVCSVSDAGVVTADNLEKYQGIYQPDGVLYKPNNKCPTCLFIKPARSKHCAISDRCYHKFDHYCAWTNNGVGGLNHRWFLLFLLSLVAVCINGEFMAVQALINVTNVYQLMTLRFLDVGGQPQPMNFRVLAQTLFMQLPRLVFLAAAMAVIGLFVACFMLYHVYLAVTNQTTNERYKRYRLCRLHNTHLNCYPYSRGIISNLLEEAFPLRYRPQCVVMTSASCQNKKKK